MEIAFLFITTLLIFFLCTDIATCLICTDEAVALLDHIASALRTLFRHRLLPGHEVALRIALAAIVTAALFRLADHDILAAERTGHADLLQIRLRVADSPGSPGRPGTFRADHT